MGKKTLLAAMILEGLGKADNIVDVTNCATRLRVNVKDAALVKDDGYFKGIGTHGISKNGKAMQVIVGLSVPSVREKFEMILANPSAYELNMDDTANRQDVAPAAEKTADTSAMTKHELKAVANGKAIPVSEVPDDVFASKALGDGVAVIVTDGKVCAPADGTISMVAETLHAYESVPRTVWNFWSTSVSIPWNLTAKASRRRSKKAIRSKQASCSVRSI